MSYQQNDPSSPLDMFVDNEMARHLADTAKWGKFLAIVGIIASIGALVAIGFGAFLPQEEEYMTDPSTRVGVIAFAAIMVGIFYIIPCVLLLRCSIKMKAALMSSNQSELTQAFKLQKNLYMFIGILTIIFLVLMVLAGVGSGMSDGN